MYWLDRGRIITRNTPILKVISEAWETLSKLWSVTILKSYIFRLPPWEWRCFLIRPWSHFLGGAPLSVVLSGIWLHLLSDSLFSIIFWPHLKWLSGKLPSLGNEQLSQQFPLPYWGQRAILSIKKSHLFQCRWSFSSTSLWKFSVLLIYLIQHQSISKTLFSPISNLPWLNWLNLILTWVNTISGIDFCINQNGLGYAIGTTNSQFSAA